MFLVQLLCWEYKNPEIPAGVLRTPSTPATQPLTLDGHPTRASLCLITFYRLRLKSVSNRPTLSQKAGLMLSQMPPSFTPVWTAALGHATQVSETQTNNVRIDFTEDSTLEREEEEKNVQNLISPLTWLPLTYLWCHLFLVAAGKYFLTLWRHAYYRLPGDSYKTLLLFFFVLF